MKVEQVLQGEVASLNFDVFYFADMGAGSFSTAPVWKDLYAGQSEIFFLQLDSGQLRTICDGWRSCIIWVRTGTHWNLKLNPLAPVEDNISKILLSRGDHTTEQQMLDAIYHSEMRWGTEPVFNVLQHLAQYDGSPTVRTAALEKVKYIQTYQGIRREPTNNY